MKVMQTRCSAAGHGKGGRDARGLLRATDVGAASSGRQAATPPCEPADPSAEDAPRADSTCGKRYKHA